MSLGPALGLMPAGLGARDTLRTEAGYSLYGHELTAETTPIEASLGWAVALDKPDFIGRETLAAQKQNGVSRRCIGFKMTSKRAPPRERPPRATAAARRGAPTPRAAAARGPRRERQ